MSESCPRPTRRTATVQLSMSFERPLLGVCKLSRMPWASGSSPAVD